MQKRQRELEALLADFEAFPHDGNSYKYWRMWNEHHVLPYVGAWVDQPAWLLDDFHYFDLLHEYHNLPHWIMSAQKRMADAGKAVMRVTG